MRTISLLFTLAFTCSGADTPIREIASLNLKEASGLEYFNGTVWTIQDSGNASVLYGFDTTGKQTAEVYVNAPNEDWESLACDKDGNLYIGDFGNNDNTRADLLIYKVDKAALMNKKANVAYAVHFSYPEQQDFSPSKSNLIYDCEAFIEHEGNFYLFTKNRSSKSDGSFMVYTIPNAAGNHKAQFLGKYKTCAEGKKCAITGADISPDGNSILLLTAQTLYEFSGFNGKDVSALKLKALDMGHSTQKEGICYIDDNRIMIVDERKKKEGGKLYEIHYNDLKSK